MGETELQAVFDHFQARRHRDLDAVAATLDPRVVHQGVEPDLVCSGRRQVLELVRSSFGRGQSGVESIEFIDAGERVIVRLTGRQFREVPFLQGELCMVFSLRDGVVTRIDDYRTRDEALAAVTMTPQP